MNYPISLKIRIDLFKSVKHREEFKNLNILNTRAIMMSIRNNL